MVAHLTLDQLVLVRIQVGQQRAPQQGCFFVAIKTDTQSTKPAFRKPSDTPILGRFNTYFDVKRYIFVSSLCLIKKNTCIFAAKVTQKAQLPCHVRKKPQK